MPKIIKDLRNNILMNATTIFLEEGFDSIDMRHVAQKTNIAVGTLYNYFPNKKELMYEVFNELWRESIKKLERLIDGLESGPGLIILFIEEFYEEMKQKKGLGTELNKLELMEAKKASEVNINKRIVEFKSYLIDLIKKVIIKGYHLSEDDFDEFILEKLSETMGILIFGFRNYADDKKSIVFMSDLIESYIRSVKNRSKLKEE